MRPARWPVIRHMRWLDALLVANAYFRAAALTGAFWWPHGAAIRDQTARKYERADDILAGRA